VQLDVAEHMRREFDRLEDFCKRRVADAQAAGIGAERRHHGALAVDANDESPEGLSPSGAPRTVREPLASYGSRCSAVAVA